MEQESQLQDITFQDFDSVFSKDLFTTNSCSQKLRVPAVKNYKKSRQNKADNFEKLQTRIKEIQTQIASRRVKNEFCHRCGHSSLQSSHCRTHPLSDCQSGMQFIAPDLGVPTGKLKGQIWIAISIIMLVMGYNVYGVNGQKQDVSQLISHESFLDVGEQLQKGGETVQLSFILSKCQKTESVQGEVYTDKFQGLGLVEFLFWMLIEDCNASLGDYTDMISKDEYRKYLLRQIADGQQRKKREKEERFGISRLPTSIDRPKAISVKPDIYLSVSPKCARLQSNLATKTRLMALSREYQIQIGTTNVQDRTEKLPESIIRKTHQQTLKDQESSKDVREFDQTLSTGLENTGEVQKRGRNLLALQNMDPSKAETDHRKKLEMQRCLLIQMQQQRNSKAVQKKKQIQEERKLQEDIQKQYMIETGGFQVRRGKKMVTNSEYFPDTVKVKGTIADRQVRSVSQQRTSYPSQQIMERVQSARVLQVAPKINNFSSLQRPVTNKKPQSSKVSVQQLSEQEQEDYRSRTQSQKSHYSRDYNQPSSRQNSVRSGRHSIRQSKQQNRVQQCAPSQSQAQVEKRQQYNSIAWELKKVRQEILAQRELITTGIAKTNMQAQKRVYAQDLKQQNVSPRNSYRPARRYKVVKKIGDRFNTQPAGLQGSELMCQSKKVPIMSREGMDQMTMSKIDDFALGDMSVRRQMEEPSFVSRNQFLDPTKRSHFRTDDGSPDLQAISQYLFSSERYQESNRGESSGRQDTNRRLSNFKEVCFQTDS